MDMQKIDFVEEIWRDKYAYNGEKTPEDMFKRLSEALSKEESKYRNPLSFEEIFELLNNFKYIILGGSPISGIGTDKKVSLSNCFFVDAKYDSYGGIFEVDQFIAQVSKRRGGVGTDLSNFRPKGLPVHNAAKKSTGIVPWMERYSNTIREVAQEGRRGALMLSIDIRHPDSPDFITAKLDKTKITGANISVKVPDDFMKAVQDDEMYTLRYPINSDKPIMTKEIRARDLWNKLVKTTRDSSEPGILFIDTIHDGGPQEFYPNHKTIGTNPCFTGDMRLLTSEGLRSFRELNGSFTLAYNSDGQLVAAKVWSNGIKNVVEVKLTDQSVIKCTPDHRFMTTEGVVEAKDLKGKTLVYKDFKETKHDDLYVKLGFIQGDGELSRLDDNKYPNHKGFSINIGRKDDDVLKLFGYKREKEGQRRFYTAEYYDVCKNLQFDPKPLPERTLPNSFKQWKDGDKLSFLRGLYTANGSVIGKTRVSLKTTSSKLANELVEVLGQFGISAYVTTNKAKVNKFSNGSYLMRESYDVNIFRYSSLVEFRNKIGFVQSYKTDALNTLLAERALKVVNVKELPDEEVFDFSLSGGNHWGIVENVVVHNCGELPLADKASCILLSLNLFEVVENPFTKDAKIDYGKLYDIAYKAQKLADDIVSLELEKIDEIIEKIKYDPEPSEIRDNEYRLWLGIKNKLYRSRRTGLGYMGAADMLAALGVPYGSDKSVDILDNVTSMIAKASYESSIDMAEDRGCFFDWMRDIDLQSNYFTRLLYQRLSRKHIKKYEVYGRRNLSNLTIAPTGTTSMMAQVSSGLEPVFMLHYKRRRKVNEDYKGDVITDSVGDRWIEFDVVHPKFKMWAEITHGIDNFYEYWGNITNEQKFALIKESPYNGSLAHEINPAQKVRIQSAVQKWIDHSISITYNLKNDVTEKEVSNLFFLAWKLKLKGITIYRDGSRDGVLISINNEEKNEFVPHDAPKRPEVLDADIFYPTIRGEKYVVMVGLLNNNPYELFCFKINGYKVPGNPTIGKIQKVRKSKRVKKYNLLSINDEVIVEDIVSKFERPEYEFATRMISTALRHGASISFIVEQLDKTDGFITDYNKVISRVLKKYVAPKITDIKCPKCGSNMIMKEGCVTCPSCGYSKC